MTLIPHVKGRSPRLKINKETLNDQVDLIDRQNIPSNNRIYICFLRARGTFSRIDHKLGHKTSLNKEKIDIICIFSDHNTVKLEIKKKNWKKHKYVEVKQHATKQTIGQQQKRK